MGFEPSLYRLTERKEVEVSLPLGGKSDCLPPSLSIGIGFAIARREAHRIVGAPHPAIRKPKILWAEISELAKLFPPSNSTSFPASVDGTRKPDKPAQLIILL